MSGTPYLRLNNGRKIPQIAFGTFDAPGDQVEKAVEYAIKCGFRHIDCASLYGNEKQVGAAIAKAMDKYNLRRKDLFVTSKLWCDMHDPRDVRSACEKSIRDLGVGYLDLYLMHWPMSFQFKPGVEFDVRNPKTLIYEYHEIEDTWEAMEELVDLGLAKSIGVSNFNHKQVRRILRSGRIAPVVNQVEVNLNCLNSRLIEYCQRKGVEIEGYAPFGSPGFMKDQGRSLLEEPVVKRLAKKYGKSPGQILLRHGLERGIVVLTKSVTPERIKSNFKVFDFSLSHSDMEKLNSAGSEEHIFDFPAFAKHPEYPFHEAY